MKVFLVVIVTFLVLVELNSVEGKRKKKKCKTVTKTKCTGGKRDDLEVLKREILHSVVESLSDENRIEHVREVKAQLDQANSMEEIRRMFLGDF